MAEAYCLDTGVFIESWWKHYRPKNFRSFWSRLEEGLKSGLLLSPMLVLEELKRKDDEVYRWTASVRTFFIELDGDLQTAQEGVINQFPKLINQARGRSLCDPWVIALAQVRACPVVTYETIGSDNKPKIPNVCHALDIRCMTVGDLIEELGWEF